MSCSDVGCCDRDKDNSEKGSERWICGFRLVLIRIGAVTR